MSNTETVLVLLAVFSGVGAGLLHAAAAAIEHLPYAQERELLHLRRPDGKATAVSKLLADPREVKNAVSVAYATLEAIAMVCLTLLVLQLGQALDWPHWGIFLAAISAAVTVAVLLVRALPRQIARTYPEGTLRVVSPPSYMLTLVTRPVRVAVPALQMPPLPEPEDLVEQAQDALADEDAQLLRGVVTLGERLTREVMVPRTDMVTLPAAGSARSAMMLFLRSGFSRVPVVGEGVDDVQGVLYLKDLVRHTWDNSDRLGDGVTEIMRTATFVPETLPVDDLLRQMQREVVHIAMVVDEFGGVAGLVTIEDALEEIVGELTDEYDPAVVEAHEISPGTYRIPARMGLIELGQLFQLEIEDDDVDTAAGLLAKAIGKVPLPGSQAEVAGLILTAERAEGRRRQIVTLIAALSPNTTDEVSDD